MGKKSAILKKLDGIIKDADTLKGKKNYVEAVRRYREGINFLRLKATDMEGREEEVSKITGMINQTHSAEIIDVIAQGRKLVSSNKFAEAMEKFKYAMEITDRIDEYTLKESEQKMIKFEISKKDLTELIEEGKKLEEEQDLDNALEIFQKALDDGNKLYEAENEDIVDIENLINQTYSSKIKKVVDIGNDYKSSGKLDDTIKSYGDALSITEKMFDSQIKEKEISNLQDQLNQIYSEKLKPFIEKAQQLISEDNSEGATKELKNAEEIVIKMFESNQKRDELNSIGKLLNPLLIGKSKQFIDKGEAIIEDPMYARSVTTIVEAATSLNEALNILKQSIDSTEKDNEIEKVSKILNKACSEGIELRENDGAQLIDQKKYEEAISELYSALSIAKNMACEEDQNKATDGIKNLINRVYIAEIEDILEDGEKFLEQKKYDKAQDIFNEAMGISNKMYVSNETEREIGRIKSLLYQAEMKGVVATGYVSEKMKKYEQELDELKNELDRANTITDAERRRKKIEDVKHQIDIVYSNLIKLVIEQGNVQADQNKFDEAGNEIENALKLTELIEYSSVRDDELKKIIVAVCDYGNLLAKQNKFDQAYEQNDKLLKITERIKDADIKTEEISKIKLLYEQQLDTKVKQDIANGKYDEAIKYCQKAIDLDDAYVGSYLNMGNAYIKKEEFDRAIEYFEKAVKLDSNYKNAWCDMGLANRLKADYDNALKNIEKAIEIDNNFALAWYRKGNVYKHKGELNKAIESYKKVIDLKPDFSKAWLFMGSIYFVNKEYNKAIELIDKAIELDSEVSNEISSIITDFKNTESKIVVKLTDLFTKK